MPSSPESAGHLHLSTAAEMHTQAIAKLGEAEDREWDDPNPETSRIATFWAGQVDMYAGMEPDTIIPLF